MRKIKIITFRIIQNNRRKFEIIVTYREYKILKFLERNKNSTLLTQNKCIPLSFETRKEADEALKNIKTKRIIHIREGHFIF